MPKVTVDQETCIGCGVCSTTCDNFEIKDGKAHPKSENVEDVGCNKDAAEACPVDAIKVG